MPDLVIRDLVAADIPALVRLNDEASPAVPITSPPEFAALVAHCTHAWVAIAGEAPVGFVLVMEPGRDYASENYRYFSQRGGDFLYVDRIVLAPAARGAGLGRELYARVFAAARARGATEVTCEVNVEPPNPGSLAFHAALGFRELGRQSTKGGEVIVALMAATVADPD